MIASALRDEARRRRPEQRTGDGERDCEQAEDEPARREQARQQPPVAISERGEPAVEPAEKAARRLRRVL